MKLIGRMSLSRCCIPARIHFCLFSETWRIKTEENVLGIMAVISYLQVNALGE